MSSIEADGQLRALRSFPGSVQHESMASSSYHSISGVQSSYNGSPDDDLEEARQRLLAHQYDNSQPAPDDHYLPPSIARPPEPAPVDNASRTSRYGSVSTYQSAARPHPPASKRYRLPLLILLGFDWGIVVFLSIICFVLLKVPHPDSTVNYWDLTINQGFFDLVIIATFRSVFNILAYTLLGWVTRIVMAVTTLASACYVPVKTYFLLDGVLANANTDFSGDTIYLIALLMLVFICFVIPWLIAFFFEFKYLPAEKARLHIPSWWTPLPWVWPRVYTIDDKPEPQEPPTQQQVPRPRAGMTASTATLDFRTPIGSSRASPVIIERYTDDELPPISEEGATPECDQALSPEDQALEREASSALEGMMEMTRNNDGWALDKTTNGVKCYSRQISGRKVLKFDGVIETPARALWGILYPGENTTEWNAQCLVNKSIHKIDGTTDVVYTVSAAMGPVSSRDFVSARKIAYRDGAYYSCSKSVVTSLSPEQSGKVRGDNGPNGYVVIPISSTHCQFIWLYNSNLKGWLPQAVVDQTVATALTGAYQTLQQFAKDRSQA